jgi:biopolymer transport protein ExbD
VILVPWINFAMFELAHGQTGRWMQLQQREVVRQRTSPWGETLSIYVDSSGRFFMNGEPIKRAELRDRLQAELATKPMAWNVYFEAHADTQLKKLYLRLTQFKAWERE